MEKNYIVKSQEVTTTSNIEEISNMLLKAHRKLVENAEPAILDGAPDSLELEPYIESVDGSVVARYKMDRNAVGFYYKDGSYVKSLRHVVSPADISGVVFEYLKDVSVNLFTTILPAGDILLFADGEAYTNSGEETILEMLENLAEDDDIDTIGLEKVLYTGVSVGNTSNIELDIHSFFYEIGQIKDDEGEVEEEYSEEDGTEDESESSALFVQPTLSEGTDKECTYPNCGCMFECENKPSTK